MNSNNRFKDRELFARIAQGDESAFEIIFHRFTPQLRAFVLGMVKVQAIADEILQDVFLKLWLNKEYLAEIQEPNAWLYKLASNLSLNHLRKQVNEYKKIKAAIQETGQNADDLLQKISAKELQELIYEAVTKLPEKRREIYLLSREEGLNHKEIAERLNLSLSTVKNQVVKALKSIQEHILNTSGIYIPLVLLLYVEINFYLA